MGSYTLFASRGCGSMIVEIGFLRAGIPFEIVDVPWDQTGWKSEVLVPLNPLGQVPTVKMPDGTVLTESAAILLHLADLRPDCGLAPPAGDPSRPAFLRWLLFLAAPIYATFTYGDVPERFVEGDAAAAELLRKGTHAHRQTLWRYVETQVKGPWFLGDRSSALDVMVWAMGGWRPGRKWFAAECPKLSAIAVAMAADPQVAAVAERNGFS